MFAFARRQVQLAVLTLLFPAAVFAQDNSGWIGKRVITHFGAVLQVGNQVVDDEGRSNRLAVSGIDRSTFRVYRVEHVNGNWLWLKAEEEDVEGWVKAEFVIPFDQALDYFTKQIRANPTESSWYIKRGNVWDEKAEYDIAIADYNEAIRLDPISGTAFLNRGLVWDNKKEYDKAIADYTEAIRLNAKDVYAYNGRGVAWARKKEYDKAIADYNEAIRLNPKFALAFSNRGVAWNHKKEYDKALVDYNEAIRLDPKFALAFKNRGNTQTLKKEYDKALADYNEAIRLDPKDGWAYRLRGTVYYEKKDFDRAIADHNEAIRINPANANFIWARGVNLQKKKQYDRAVADYNEAIRIDPKYVNAYNGRAWLFATCPDQKYRDGTKAVESATRACELSEWKHAFYLGTLAAAYAENGDFAKAVEWQEKANKLYTDSDVRKKAEERLYLYKEKKPYRETD